MTRRAPSFLRYAARVVYDCIIIGAGTMGVAAALALARRGAAVLAFDRDRVPNTASEHFGEARLFRTAYYEHPAYVPLLGRARQLWLRLNDEAGRELYAETGAVYGSYAGGEVVPRSVEAARRHGVPIEELSLSRAEAKFETLRFGADWTVAYEPRAGVLRPEAAVESMARLAREAGATIGTHEPVVSVTETPDGIRVVTDRAQYAGRAGLVCAGAWSSGVLRVSGLDSPTITASRQVIGWMKPEDPGRFAVGEHPCWAAEDGPGSLLYGFPVLPGAADFRVARHRLGPACDPDVVDRAVSATDVGDFEPGVRRHLVEPGVVSRAAIACYSNSADGHFLIDRVPGRERVWVASGFSGHGFKFAPVIGEVMAGLILDGRCGFDLTLFGAARFTPPSSR